ncbi:hypothetical protein H6P81_010102 [Aristolochia fimbriata]|uniref:Endonuclease V n=1 Tax=Aristolochia fimbriata TaxID=158543 RepID=A0AAV7ER68_ARIFI|nr:hypothetical protein H6P81_010102 [Aristolochia fimbriata]
MFLGDPPQTKSEASSNQLNWVELQDSLKKRLVLKDDFFWAVPAHESYAEKLQYIGGVDISFSKDDPDVACGALVILNIDDLRIVYDDFAVVKLETPYVPGFLAFREAPILLGLLEKMKQRSYPFYPQLLMVDGNGILHPRGFGLACHLGVFADIPTIGVGKNLHHVDGLTISGVKQLFDSKTNGGDSNLVTLTGNSGSILGAAMRATSESFKPIFVSVGHRISLETAIEVVKICCKYRVPEPIRQVPILLILSTSVTK